MEKLTHTGDAHMPCASKFLDCMTSMNARQANSVLKRPTNLSINAGLFDEARKLGVNLAQTLDERLGVFSPGALLIFRACDLRSHRRAPAPTRRQGSTPGCRARC
ncbi:MAG: hypothetical protein EXR28_10250 [Betaproteobacteria bacterium]|nr:hypothetical protein [Betaproteobacteria bacterium]